MTARANAQGTPRTTGELRRAGGSDAPLMQLGESTTAAVEGVLQTVAPGAARVGRITAGHGEQAAEQAVAGLTLPAVAADVSYVDGVTGGNVFLLPVEGARRLAAAMMGSDPASAAEGGELSELELSAVGEAMNQMMSAAALATGGVLGQEVEIAPPQIRVVETEAEAAELLRATAAPHILSTGFTVADAPSRLVQLVPNAFVVRMDRALDAQTTEYTSAPLGSALRAVPVRVWAELGRARMPAGASLGLATGSVVELDREVEDPVDLYVDGLHFATGRLLVADDGSLQLEIETILGLNRAEAAEAADAVPMIVDETVAPVAAEAVAPVAAEADEPVAAEADEPAAEADEPAAEAGEPAADHMDVPDVPETATDSPTESTEV
jgi:flagellar motor switch protein FliN/FliY